MDNREEKILIIIPAFNEENTIVEVVNNIFKEVGSVRDIKLLVVDDGSTDNTRKKVKENTNALIISHIVNKGVGSAFSTGINYALKNDFDVVVNIDADGQFDVREMGKLINPIIKKKADLVVGNRFSVGKPQNMPLVKYYGNKLMNGLIGYIVNNDFQDVSCGFRSYSREALFNLNLFGRFTYTQETFLDLSYKNLNILQVPVSVKYFKDRKSRVANNVFSYALKTLKIIIRSALYYKPLRFFAYPGIFLLVIGFGFIGFLFIHRITMGAYTPYKSFGFIGGGLALFGFLMIFLGLIADIIDKIRQNQDKILYYTKKNIYERRKS